MNPVTEQDYSDLCAGCDRLLLAPGASVERIAISWLHVLNEHPSNLAKYEGVLSSRPSGRALALKSAALQLRQWLRGRRARKARSSAPGPVDVMFISHLLNEKQAGAPEDFYFGRAPEVLRGKGFSTCVVLHNNTALAADSLEGRWPAGMAPRFILRNALEPRGEFDLRRRLAAEARRLDTPASGAETALQRRIREEAGRQALAIPTITTLRLYLEIDELIRAHRPKAVVVTFEGHAWERLAFVAAREAVPGAVCAGYHHTIVFPRQHAALRPLGPRLDPDVILTAGQVSRRRFHDAYAARPVKVLNMGIHRRQEEVGGAEGAPATACLVIPDAIFPEIVFLLDLALKAALEAPDIPFILRLHPMVPREQLLQKFPRFRSLPANVSFSSGSLNDDLRRARSVLYRGSNASIYAVIAGLRPFYASREDELAIDCLHQVHTWKKVVSSAAGLVAGIRADGALNRETRAAEAAEAVAFCRSYFTPVDLDVLVAALG